MWEKMPFFLFLIYHLFKHYILKIKSSSSINNNHFGCFLGSDDQTHCFIEILSNNFREITCAIQKNCKDIETYYFIETNEFALICKNLNVFKIIRFNSDNIQMILNSNICQNFLIKKEITIDNCRNINDYSLIYFNKVYSLITDCEFPKLYPISEINENINNINITYNLPTDYLVNDYFEEEIYDNNENKEEKDIDEIKSILSSFTSRINL